MAGVTVLGLGAAACRVRKQQTARRVVGVTWPVNTKFDPLNLGSTDAKMQRYTDVEIKHGRVAMIATVGYILPDMFRFPGCEGFGNGLSALNTLPVEGWIQLLAFVGAHEVLVKPRQGGMGGFDLGLGTELLEGIDAEELERRQTVERNNGRLAMVAFIGMAWQDATFGKTPLAMFVEDGFWGPDVNFLIKDIPICSGTALCAMDKTTEMSPSVPYLAYPYGRLNKQVLDATREAGYAAAFSTQPGFNRQDVDHYRIRRLDVFGTDTATMLARKIFFGSNDGSWKQTCRYYKSRVADKLGL